MDKIKEMKEAMKAIKKACKKFDFCNECPFKIYCFAGYEDEDFLMPERWNIDEKEI